MRRDCFILSILLCQILCSLFLTHCNKKNSTESKAGGPLGDMVGTWVLTSVTLPNPFGGEPITGPPELIDLTQTIILNADGSFTETGTDEGEPYTEFGTWSATASVITLNVPGESPMQCPYTIDGYTLTVTVTIDGEQMIFTYTKQAGAT